MGKPYYLTMPWECLGKFVFLLQAITELDNYASVLNKKLTKLFVTDWVWIKETRSVTMNIFRKKNIFFLNLL